MFARTAVLSAVVMLGCASSSGSNPDAATNRADASGSPADASFIDAAIHDAGSPDALCGDCSSLDDTCNVGVCNFDAGGCVQVPRMGTISCNDGDNCTINDTCVSGTCMGDAPDCSGTATTCRAAGSCDPGGAVGNCDTPGSPLNETMSCDDCAAGSGNCTQCMAGVCADAVCGDNLPGPLEDCDDGNTDSFDGCSATCNDPVAHLLISEIVVTPTNGEFIEIYNPTASSVSLASVYLADFNTYHQITSASASPLGSDFLIQFPASATIAAGGFAVVSLESATAFQGVYGAFPDYDLDASDANAPVMLGSFSASSGLTNGDEIVVLFSWDGAADLVTDIDYLIYGNTSDAADKTGISNGGSTYNADTAMAAQVAASSHSNGSSLHRCDTAERTETKTGGNGTSGHDETSENLAMAFKVATPSPGAAPTAGVCP